MIEHPIGVVVAVGAILVFHGSVYALASLNLGWRFGYWVTGASLFGLMTVMSTFWAINALGPRGTEPHWVPVGADAQNISQATVKDTNLSSFGRYPGGDWETVEEGDPRFEELDGFRSAAGNCLDSDPETLPGAEVTVCADAQQLLPEELPRIEGMPIIATNEFRDIRFNEEEGILLAQAIVQPVTRDPRITQDPDGEPVGEAFLIAAARDPGTLRLPALKYLGGSALLLLLHLWGLARAERKVLSPVVAL